MAQDKRASQILKNIFGRGYDAIDAQSLLPTVAGQVSSYSVDRTYYVDPVNGDDNNQGFNPNHPLRNIQFAVDRAIHISTGGFNTTVQLADGTYPGVSLKAHIGNGRLSLNGNPTTPANVIIQEDGSNTVDAIRVEQGGRWTIANLKMLPIAPSGVHHLSIGRRGYPGDFHYLPGQAILENVIFGGPPRAQHVFIGGGGSHLFMGASDITIEMGDPITWLLVVGGAEVDIRGTVIKLTGSGSVNNFVEAQGGSFVLSTCTIDYTGLTGPVGGNRCTSVRNAVIETYGRGNAHFPGDIDGTTATGGIIAAS